MNPPRISVLKREEDKVFFPKVQKLLYLDLLRLLIQVSICTLKKVRSRMKRRQYIKFLFYAPDWWGCHPDHLTMGSFAQAPFQMVQKIMNVVTEMTSSTGTPTINIPQSLEV